MRGIVRAVMVCASLLAWPLWTGAATIGDASLAPTPPMGWNS